MTTPTLPPLPHDRVDAIETAVFGRIADDRERPVADAAASGAGSPPPRRWCSSPASWDRG